jgi:hypothetical protein
MLARKEAAAQVTQTSVSSNISRAMQAVDISDMTDVARFQTSASAIGAEAAALPVKAAGAAAPEREAVGGFQLEVLGQKLIQALIDKKDDATILPLITPSTAKGPRVSPLSQGKVYEFGHLPLQVAVANNASATVVRRLLEAHPDGAKATNTRGELPLHQAAGSKVCVDGCWVHKVDEAVVRLLLEAHPDGAKAKTLRGWLPLHFAADSCDDSPYPDSHGRGVCAASARGLSAGEGGQDERSSLRSRPHMPLHRASLLAKRLTPG